MKTLAAAVLLQARKVAGEPWKTQVAPVLLQARKVAGHCRQSF